MVHDQTEDVGSVISPEFETELVKEVLDLSQQPLRRRSVVRLRDLKSVAQRNPCEHDRAHGSTSREVCQACSLQRENKAVVDVETVAHRPQGVTGGGKLAIQRNSDAILEDSHGVVSETSTTYTKSQTCLRQSINGPPAGQ